MDQYLRRHPEVISIFVIFLMVFLIGGTSHDSTRSEDIPTPVFQSTPTLSFRGVEPPNFEYTPAPGENTRGLQQTNRDNSPIIFSENFSEDSPLIMRDEYFIRADKFGNRSLRLLSSQLYDLPFNYVEDLRFTANIKLRQGALHFNVRQSGAGGYSVVIKANGKVTLRRAGMVVASSRLPDRSLLKNGMTLRIEARGNRVIVRLGGERLIVFDDAQPLPYGVISFGAVGDSKIRAVIDDLSLHANIASEETRNNGVIEAMSVAREGRLDLPLSNDPNRIYFNGYGGADLTIYSSKPDGSDIQPVVTNARAAAISPDGRRLAFASNRDGGYRVWIKYAEGFLFKVPLPANSLAGLSTFHENISWAPDSLRIAYTTNGTTKSYDSNNWPVWTESSELISFDTRTNTSIILYTRTGNQHTSTPGTGPFCSSGWSPDGSIIALGVPNNGRCKEMLGISSDLSQSPVLMYQGWISRGKLSPDGTKIAFSTIENDHHTYWSTLSVGTVSSTYQIENIQVILYRSDEEFLNVAWSPSSDILALAAYNYSQDLDYIEYFDLSGQSILDENGELIRIEDAGGWLSWYGDATFYPDYEKCISVPVPSQGVSLYNAPSTDAAATTPHPANYRMQFSGQLHNLTLTPWLRVNAVIPDYATNPTPAAIFTTPHWVSAGAFSNETGYVDPCDDDPLINNPPAGFANEVIYLPYLGQPERTLTPTPTPTEHPGCYLAQTSVVINVRVYPNGSLIGQIQSLETGIRVSGQTQQTFPNSGGTNSYHWYRVYREGGWNNVPENEYGWVSDEVADLEGTYECSLLNLFDAAETPVALPTYTPSMTPLQTYSPTPTLGPSATPTATPTRIPRIVVTQAVPLQQLAPQIGLPLPFSVWPRATPEASAPIDRSQNGYGPNQFAFDTCRATTPIGPCQYTYTAKIHQGLDYYVLADQLSGPVSSTCVNPLNGGAVYAVCDGVIVPGISDGGSARPNSLINGLSLRCFADEPRDPDNDGQPNLSNIIVVYNHLSPSSLPSAMTVIEAGQLLGYTRNYNVESIPTPTPQPCIAAHLDLQVFVAQDFAGDTRSEQIQINPLMLFSQELANRHFEGAGSLAYPAGYEPFTLQGNTLDWFGLNYWNDPSNPAFISDIADYLAGVSYSPPNCILDTGNSTCELIIPNDMD